MKTSAFRSAQPIVCFGLSLGHPRDFAQFLDVALECLMATILADDDAELPVDRAPERPQAAHKVLGFVSRDDRNDDAGNGADCGRNFRHSTPQNNWSISHGLAKRYSQF
jgi:hypothetical protein